MICDNCLKETDTILQLTPTSSWGLCPECYERIKKLDEDEHSDNRTPTAPHGRL